MKKLILSIFLAILIGLIFSKIVFNQYNKELVEVFADEEIIYVFQQGVYSNLENVAKYTKNSNFYIVEEDDPYFRVYVAITKNKQYINKIKEVFIELGNDIYVRELKVNNLAFLELLAQYDKLTANSETAEQILQIQKQVLSKYEELVIRNE
jgi:hypothetical protein